MSQIYFNKRRIRKLNLPESYSLEGIQIGVPVKKDEDKKVGLNSIGDVVLPSEDYGVQSRRNAYGYSYPDKTKPKERRYVSTNWIYPFGNTNASEIPVDIYRECFPKVEVPPYEIHLMLTENDDNERFVIVDLDARVRNEHLKDAVNLMLEIYGECYIFDGEIKIKRNIKKRKIGWEILPQGEMPSRHCERQFTKYRKKPNGFLFYRLEYIEKYDVIDAAEGLNGFKGYFAYVFNNCCVLESAVYGNATYIIPRENWEELSQKTKRLLFDEDKVIDKVVHNKKWKQNITQVFDKLGVFKK